MVQWHFPLLSLIISSSTGGTIHAFEGFSNIRDHQDYRSNNHADHYVDLSPFNHFGTSQSSTVAKTGANLIVQPYERHLATVTCGSERNGTLVFSDPIFVDERELTNTLEAITSFEVIYSELNNYTTGLFAVGALDGLSTLIVPELELKSLYQSLSAEDVVSIQDFAATGGTLIVLGANSQSTGWDVELINGVFGLNVSHFGGGQECQDLPRGESAVLTSAAVGTPFASGPASIPWRTSVYCLDPTTFPAGSSVLYSYGATSWASRMLQGAVVHLGYDWFRTSEGADWNQLLLLAMDSSDLSCRPTAEPTAVPSQNPSTLPSANPTGGPTQYRTAAPTVALLEVPTAVPTAIPIAVPVAAPTIVPTPPPLSTACGRDGTLVFSDPIFVDERELTNTLEAITSFEVIYSELNNYTTGLFAAGALDGLSTLIVPELELKSLYQSLSAEDVVSIQDFAATGGTLIVLGANSQSTGWDVELINGVFGLNVSHFGGGQECQDLPRGERAVLTSAAVGTPFASGPASIPWRTSVYCLDPTTFPAGSSVLYSYGATSWASRMLQGAVVHLGYDWFRTSEGADWNQLLLLAMDSSDLSCRPTAEPTAVPSQNPSTLPSANPTAGPTQYRTAAPTAEPTVSPTALPSQLPTEIPSNMPVVAQPTLSPNNLPSTAAPTTTVPTSAAPTTAVPTTTLPTTAEPTTAEPTTAVPTTAVPTTAVPTTAVPTTAVPTTAVPTTAVPSGIASSQAPSVDIGQPSYFPSFAPSSGRRVE